MRPSLRRKAPWETSSTQRHPRLRPVLPFPILPLLRRAALLLLPLSLPLPPLLQVIRHRPLLALASRSRTRIRWRSSSFSSRHLICGTTRRRTLPIVITSRIIASLTHEPLDTTLTTCLFFPLTIHFFPLLDDERRLYNYSERPTYRISPLIQSSRTTASTRRLLPSTAPVRCLAPTRPTCTSTLPSRPSITSVSRRSTIRLIPRLPTLIPINNNSPSSLSSLLARS
jgi:hypothetical protein